MQSYLYISALGAIAAVEGSTWSKWYTKPEEPGCECRDRSNGGKLTGFTAPGLEHCQQIWNDFDTWCWNGDNVLECKEFENNWPFVCGGEIETGSNRSDSQEAEEVQR